MGIDGKYFADYFQNKCFGRVWEKDNRLLQGRGVGIWQSGEISIGYFDSGNPAPGGFISIHPNGAFYVGSY